MGSIDEKGIYFFSERAYTLDLREMTMQKNLITQYKKARAAATPLIAINTPDPAETMRAIQSSLNADSKVPLAKWDCVGGAIGLNDAGSNALLEISRGNQPNEIVNVIDILVFAETLPAKSVLFILNGHSYFKDQDNKQYIQALWNLRDVFKAKFCTVVLLGPAFVLPEELKQDIFVIDSPYPDDEELKGILDRVTTHNKVTIKASQVVNTIDSLRGLAAFPSEQVIAMALEKTGIDSEAVWERKRKIIEANDGMMVWREGPKRLGGLKQAQDFFMEYINGRNAPRAIVFIDEIEKSSIGSGLNDSSGTSADQLGVMLTKMVDNAWTGSILYGHAGTGKTQLAKNIGNMAGVPTIYWDLGAMKGGIVGESEHKIRSNIKVIEAIAQDRALFLATCNEHSLLKPELKRRFGLPTFFFDLLTAEERMAVKEIYCKKYDFDLSIFDNINDEGWTGAEIERCCKLAWELRTTPDKTAKYVVPIARSSAKEIERRRREADGVFLSASYDGYYKMERNPMPVYDVGAPRTVEFEN